MLVLNNKKKSSSCKFFESFKHPLSLFYAEERSTTLKGLTPVVDPDLRGAYPVWPLDHGPGLWIRPVSAGEWKSTRPGGDP